jgi:hypothetical protein
METKTALCGLITKQEQETEKLVEFTLSQFRLDVNENRVVVANDLETSTPVIKWQPPAGWHKAHKNIMLALASESGFLPSWNGCPSCPIAFQLSVDEPQSDNEGSTLVAAACAEFLLKDYHVGMVSGLSKQSLVSVLEPFIRRYLGLFESGIKHRIGECCDCLCKRQRAKLHAEEGPQNFIIPREWAVREEWKNGAPCIPNPDLADFK